MIPQLLVAGALVALERLSRSRGNSGPLTELSERDLDSLREVVRLLGRWQNSISGRALEKAEELLRNSPAVETWLARHTVEPRSYTLYYGCHRRWGEYDEEDYLHRPRSLQHWTLDEYIAITFAEGAAEDEVGYVLELAVPPEKVVVDLEALGRVLKSSESDPRAPDMAQLLRQGARFAEREVLVWGPAAGVVKEIVYD